MIPMTHKLYDTRAERCCIRFFSCAFLISVALGIGMLAHIQHNYAAPLTTAVYLAPWTEERPVEKYGTERYFQGLKDELMRRGEGLPGRGE